MPVKLEAQSRKRRASEPEPIRWPMRGRQLPAGVVAVRLLWVDFSGIRRCRVIPASRWPSVVSGASPVRLARACVALQTTMDATTPPTTRGGGTTVDAAGVVGDVVLYPATRPAVLPWHRSHAVCLCMLRKLPEPEEEGMERAVRGGGGGGSDDGDDDDVDPFFEGGDPRFSSPEARAFSSVHFELCPRLALGRSVIVAKYGWGSPLDAVPPPEEASAERTNDDEGRQREKPKPRRLPQLSFRFGFEVEFKLVPRRRRGEEAPGGSLDAPFNYCSTRCLDAAAAALDAVVAAVDELLSNAGLRDCRIEQYHGESGEGCFEVVVSHAGALEAVDALVLTREAIVGAAGAFRGGGSDGYDVTFLPKPDGPEAAGLGSHVHFSVYDARGENLTVDLARKWRERWTREGRQEQQPASTSTTRRRLAFSTAEEAAENCGESFVAGVFNRLDEIVPFTSCGPTSFMRKKPGCWSGAYKTWGPANKESPLRVLRDNVEYKSLDATANPYLAVAAIVAAGWCGVRRRERLPAPPRGDEAKLLVASTEEALAALSSWEQEEGGDGLRPFFCSDLLDTLRSLKRADEEAMRGWSYEETRKRLSLIY